MWYSVANKTLLHFLSRIFFCELKLYSQGVALITPENRCVGSASASLTEGWVRKLLRIFPQLQTSMPPRNTRRNDLVFTLPPNPWFLCFFTRFSCAPTIGRRKNRFGGSQELCTCLMLPQGPDKGRKDPFAGERQGQRVKQLVQNLNWVSSRAGV